MALSVHPSVCPSVCPSACPNYCNGRSTVLLEDQLYYWKISYFFLKITSIIGKSTVLKTNRNRLKPLIKENNNIKTSNYVTTICIASSFTRIWTTRTHDNSYPWQLLLKTTRTQNNSYPGQLIPKTTHTQDNSYPGQLVPKTTRTLVVWYDMKWFDMIWYHTIQYHIISRYDILPYHIIYEYHLKKKKKRRWTCLSVILPYSTIFQSF